MKALFIIYADMEALLSEICTCHINPNISSTTKVSMHTASSYFLVYSLFI